MSIWAFGTSPHGLGMTPNALWRLTTREYVALSDVQHQSRIQWAIERVWYAEAHRDPSKDSMPWQVDDFLIPGNRDYRRAEHDQMRREVDKENRRLLLIKQTAPGEEPPDWVPEWARGKKRA